MEGGFPNVITLHVLKDCWQIWTLFILFVCVIIRVSPYSMMSPSDLGTSDRPWHILPPHHPTSNWYYLVLWQEWHGSGRSWTIFPTAHFNHCSYAHGGMITHTLSPDTQHMLTTRDFYSRLNAALMSGPVVWGKILAGTMRSSKLFTSRMLLRFSIFKHIALQVTEICCTHCNAISCGTHGKISYNCGRHSLTPSI